MDALKEQIIREVLSYYNTEVEYAKNQMEMAYNGINAVYDFLFKNDNNFNIGLSALADTFLPKFLVSAYKEEKDIEIDGVNRYIQYPYENFKDLISNGYHNNVIQYTMAYHDYTSDDIDSIAGYVNEIIGTPFKNIRFSERMVINLYASVPEDIKAKFSEYYLSRIAIERIHL